MANGYIFILIFFVMGMITTIIYGIKIQTVEIATIVLIGLFAITGCGVILLVIDVPILSVMASFVSFFIMGHASAIKPRRRR